LIVISNEMVILFEITNFNIYKLLWYKIPYEKIDSYMINSRTEASQNTHWAFTRKFVYIFFTRTFTMIYLIVTCWKKFVLAIFTILPSELLLLRFCPFSLKTTYYFKTRDLWPSAVRSCAHVFIIVNIT